MRRNTQGRERHTRRETAQTLKVVPVELQKSLEATEAWVIWMKPYALFTEAGAVFSRGES